MSESRYALETVRNNVTIDLILRANVQAQLRVFVKRILRKHSYPPDKQDHATRTLLEQAQHSLGPRQRDSASLARPRAISVRLEALIFLKALD